MANCPIAGVIWQHLHYIAGLKRLGHEIYYVEDSAFPPYDPVSYDTGGCTYAVKTLRTLAKTFDFQHHWAYCARYLDPPQSFGLELSRLRELYREADAILNVCGSHELHDDLLKSDALIYLESDPGVEQIKVDQGNATTRSYLQHYRALFTFGENIGTSNFPIPLHGLRWLPTRQPIVIDFWKEDSALSAEAIFTTIANWSTHGQKDITWNGETYLWSKSDSFRHFINVPGVAGEAFEIATDIKDKSVADLFRRRGWRLRNPHELSVDWRLYQNYIRGSRGEFTVTKDQYVRLQTGWFSDRSACYLAAGRPVITQETGFSRLYGGNRGLFAFSDLREIGEAVAAIRANYKIHSKAAYEIAKEFFDAEAVLSSLLNRAGV